MQLQPHELVEQSQRIAKLEQENQALKAEVIDLWQQLAIANKKNLSNYPVESVIIDEELPTEVLLRQRTEAALGDSDRLLRYTFE